MKLTKTIPLAVVAAFAASAASAQVAASFNGLVDDVVADTNAAFFSGAVNTADIDGSINITAGSDSTPGSESTSNSENAASEESSTIDVTVFTNTDNTLFDEASGAGSFNETQNAIDKTISNNVTTASSAANSAASSATNTTYASVQQNFGDVSSVAAGAINDGTLGINETGALASVDIDSSTGTTAFGGVASNTAGADVGSVQGALNVGEIDGSITMAVTNANVGASSIGSVAAGAINTSDVTATFVGGDNAESNVTTP